MRWSSLRTVAAEELRGLWRRGWGPWVLLGISLILSVAAVAMAYTSQINLLDALEGMTVLVKITLGVGLALMLFAAADSISGERDRASLESYLLTPIDGRSLVFGKAIAAWTWWVAVLIVSLPYLWILGTGLGMRARGVAVSMLAGLAMSVLLVVWGSLFSLRSSSSTSSVGAAVISVLVLAVPGQIPGAVLRGPVGTAVKAIDPVTAGLEFVDRVLVAEIPFGEALPWLLSPLAWAVLSALVLFRMSRVVPLEPRP